MRPPPPPAPDISQNVSSPTTVRLGLLLMNFPRFQPATRKKQNNVALLLDPAYGTIPPSRFVLKK
jgi:hypothetical protein